MTLAHADADPRAFPSVSSLVPETSPPTRPLLSDDTTTTRSPSPFRTSPTLSANTSTTSSLRCSSAPLKSSTRDSRSSPTGTTWCRLWTRRTRWSSRGVSRSSARTRSRSEARASESRRGVASGCVRSGQSKPGIMKRSLGLTCCEGPTRARPRMSRLRRRAPSRSASRSTRSDSASSQRGRTRSVSSAVQRQRAGPCLAAVSRVEAACCGG